MNIRLEVKRGVMALEVPSTVLSVPVPVGDIGPGSGLCSESVGM